MIKHSSIHVSAKISILSWRCFLKSSLKKKPPMNQPWLFARDISQVRSLEPNPRKTLHGLEEPFPPKICLFGLVTLNNKEVGSQTIHGPAWNAHLPSHMAPHPALILVGVVWTNTTTSTLFDEGPNAQNTNERWCWLVWRCWHRDESWPTPCHTSSNTFKLYTLAMP